MIYINYDGPASPMLHTKFRGNRPTGSGEEDLGHVTWTIYINFRSPFLRMLHMKFGFDWPRGSLKLWTTDDDGRRTDAEAWVYYKLTCEPSAQVS